MLRSLLRLPSARCAVRFVWLAVTVCCVNPAALSQHHHHHDDVNSGLADPQKHDFADPKLGRDGYELASEQVNEFRVYDFYKRQADHYCEQPPTRFLPAFPGLDAGLHGHWGKYNQNNHSDDRWNRQTGSSLQGAILHVGKDRVNKSINVQLGATQQVGVSFDPWTLSYRYAWNGGRVQYEGYRWGTSRGVRFSGAQLWSHSGRWRNNNPRERMSDAAFDGLYRYGQRVVFSYRLGESRVLDAPWAVRDGKQCVVIRQLQCAGPGAESAQTPATKLPLFQPPADTQLVQVPQTGRLSLTGFQHGETMWLVACSEGLTVQSSVDSGSVDVMVPSDSSLSEVRVWSGAAADQAAGAELLQAVVDSQPPSQMVSGGPPQWTETVTLAGERSAADGPYVVDRLPVPFKNPYHSVMMFSGIDFLPNGDALVATLTGDIWRVGGIDDDLQQVTWKRFASGLHQPFGLWIEGDDIFVQCKDRMLILRDLNQDGEADFYENYDNSWLEDKGHTHVFGGGRDDEGNFYFPAYDLFYKLPPDGSGVQLMAKGFRNCMGVAVRRDGLVLAAPQEGTWTPSSMIIDVQSGEHYGFQRSNEPISPPMCFIPRGVDNSTGGMVFMDSPRWGPLGQATLGLSYGYGSHYLILRDESGQRAQGATVPLPGEFTSGVVRGQVRPQDGQLYVVGTDGWGNYALDDGCLNRVRYTGQPVYQPIGFQVHSNGLRIDFTEPVDPKTAADPSRYFVQQWNYEHSRGYGSVEFSVFRPHTIGHDRVTVNSVQVLDGGRSVFLEIPRIVPCYQMHVNMRLQSASGTEFETDLFPTILSLGERYEFSGAVADVPGRLSELQLRVKEPGKVVLKGHDPKRKVGRTISLSAVSGIQYDRKTLVAHAGESIELKLQNKDGMPHNLVLVQPGAYETIGKAAFAMLNDPTAIDRQYVPESDDVITHTAVVFPRESSSTKFVVPSEPGAYPFLCTFPGHWQSMRGQLVVVPADQPLPDPNDEAFLLATLDGKLKAEPVSELASAAAVSGDPRRGATLFYNQKVSCANCHDPQQGSRIGPHLIERHQQTNHEYLVEAVLNPSKHIRKGYETVVVMTFDGRMRSGVKVSEDGASVSLRDLASDGKLLTYRKEDLDDLVQSDTSSMPAGLVNNLTDRQQFLDLMSFVFAIADGGQAKLDELKP
ncbi:MAG: plastocyanin/azurin family copper-binding protein [Planctomycetaceae bacterium]|nr:plastocyanin/azurin family copper-binding protein [Planctomycetaceae bacterium]